MTFTAAFAPLPELGVLASRWRALEARSDGSSFFLGWTWIESWLSTSGAAPELLIVQSQGIDVALALIGRAMVPRLLGPVATLALNQSSIAAQDRGFIEYNGLLKAADAPDGVEAAAIMALSGRNDWRALQLAGVSTGSDLPSCGRFRRRIRTDVSPAYFVDLAAVRGASGDYLSLLSANSRSQIKRSIKDHGAEIAICAASTAEKVKGWLAEMRALNAGRHADNAWDDAGFYAFARALALRGLETGEVELLRITAGDHLLGYLLNFVYGGRAMNYQSAFTAPLSGKAKPGLMCHAVAVGRYADAGLTLYSLLAGKDRYKQSLATGQEELEWWTLERFSLRLEAEALLRKILKRPASA
jgi:CelD/BcsL family acetyltransferase involved in cellulose biosynthesis